MNKVSIEEIVKFVETKMDMNLRKTMNSRKREYVDARALVYKLAKDYTTKPFSVIGGIFDKDHATAMHGINNIFPVALASNKVVREVYTEFKIGYETGSLFGEVDLDLLAIEEKAQEYKKLYIETALQLRKESTKKSRFDELLEDFPESKLDYLFERMKPLIYMVKTSRFNEPVQPKEMEGALL